MKLTLAAKDAPPVKASADEPDALPPADTRRAAMAAALAAGWPADGQRRTAHMALAGACRASCLSEAEASAFVCEVYRALGDERPTVHAGIVRQTYAKPDDAHLTGWTTLAKHVDPVVVGLVRKGLNGEAASEARLAGLQVAANDEQAPAPERLGLKYGAWDTEPPPIEFLVDGLLPRACVGMIFGRADTLKTWILFSLGIAVASGEKWLGRFPVQRAAKVGLIDYETGNGNVTRRLYMLRAGTNPNLGAKSFAKLKPNDPEFWFALELEGLALVIIDSLRKANPGAKENESDESIVPLELAAEFSERTGCAVLFIHHAKKTTSDGWPEFRGSGAIEDQVDCSFAVRKTDVTAERKTVEVRCDKPGDMRTPEPFTVEVTFDDVARSATLRHVEQPAKVEAAPVDKNRETILSQLQGKPAGVPKADLIAVLTGRKEVRLKALAELALASITVEFKQQKTVYVMLNPHANAA